MGILIRFVLFVAVWSLVFISDWQDWALWVAVVTCLCIAAKELSIIRGLGRTPGD